MENAKEIFMYLFAAIVCIGILILLAMLIAYRPEMSDSIQMIIGALIAVFTMIASYFFGSSKGSQDKNKMIKP